jgi:hypothetical protein
MMQHLFSAMIGGNMRWGVVDIDLKVRGDIEGLVDGTAGGEMLVVSFEFHLRSAGVADFCQRMGQKLFADQPLD